MTSLLQPLDTHINAAFKGWIREAIDGYILRKEEEGTLYEKWSVSDKRVMTTHVVAEAWQKLQTRSELVQRSFQQCGISVAPDGSQDHLIRLKGIEKDKIDFQGWENAEDITVKMEAEDEIPIALDELELFVQAHEELTTYTMLNCASLQELCKERGLKTTYKRKQELVQRLQSHDIRGLGLRLAGTQESPVDVEAVIPAQT
jgi:hypothetical protein